MRYCKKCTMPDTRPGITFDSEGVCSACRHYENRKNVDWDARFKEFEAYCNKYRGMNGPGGYDCAVAVSGGKDSHFQVWMLKEVMHMNPILFSVEDNFPMTQAGIHNLKNISEEFGCTIISCKPNIRAQKVLMRKFFEKYGKPTWYVDRLIYTFPLHMAAKFNTPMLCYGENVSFEYGGCSDKETYSAMDQIENGVAVGFPMEELVGDGVTENDLSLTLAPSHPNNAEKEKALQVSADFLQDQPFSCQNNPPLVWNRGQGFTLLLPSLKSMVSSSPSTPTACPRSTVCPRVTESSCRPYR